MMGAKKTIAARFYQLKSGHALLANYLLRIGKRSDMTCWWCQHEYQTRDHLFKWCKRWKREQEGLWVDRQDGEEGYEGVEKVFKKPKISLPMSLVFAEEKCSQALLDFLSCTDVGRISGVVEEADNSDHEELSDGGGVNSLMFSFCWQFLLLWGRGLATLLLFLYVTEEAGRKCVWDMPWPPVAECNMITNKQSIATGRFVMYVHNCFSVESQDSHPRLRIFMAFLE